MGSTSLCYQLFSPHGDTTMIMDPQGNPYITCRYDAFGNAIAGTGLYYGYTGKFERYTDETTQLVEMVREFDPTLGRFTSQDPLKGTPTDPQQRNRLCRQQPANQLRLIWILDGFLEFDVEQKYSSKISKYSTTV